MLAEACAVAFVLDRVSLSERAYRAWILALLLLAWAVTCFVAYAVRSTA